MRCDDRARDPQIRKVSDDTNTRQQTGSCAYGIQRLHGGEQQRPAEGVIDQPSIPLRIQ